VLAKRTFSLPHVAIHCPGRLREIAALCLKLLKLLTPKHRRRRNSRSTLVERGADALHGGIGSFVLRDRVKRLGVLWGFAENDNVYEPYLSAFKQRLHDPGWIDGRNVRVEYRFTGGITTKACVVPECLRSEWCAFLGFMAFKARSDQQVSPNGTTRQFIATHRYGRYWR
jgi:hypothetical protein